MRTSFGSQRIERYYRAAEDLRVGDLVRSVKSPHYGVKRSKDDFDVIGAAVHGACKGEGVWILVYGPNTGMVR